MRFREFEGEWETCTFSEIGTFFKGTGISKEQLTEEGTPCILYGELYTKYKNEIIKEVKSKTSIDTKNLVFSKANDIIIPSSGETAIDISTACCVTLDNVLLGGDLNVIRPHKHNGSFISYQLNGKRKYDIAKIAQGSSVIHLYNSSLQKLKVNVPRDRNEEDKIVALLSLLDDRIFTQSQIIEELKSLKKGMQYVIFAKDIYLQKQQKIKLCDILEEYSEKNKENNLIPVAVGKFGIRKREDIYSKDLSNDYSKNKVITKDTLVIGMGSTQIDIGVLLTNDKYCVSPAYTTYKVNNIHSKYLEEYLSAINSLLSKKYMIVSARQGKSVDKTELLNHKIKIHNEEEQRKIANIFSTIDKKIEIEKQILKKYAEQKKYLLANMFI